MELPLGTLLVTACLAVYHDERRLPRSAWRTGLLAGALFWTRPEGLLLLPILALDQALALGTRSLRGAALRRSAGLLAAWAALAVPLLVFNATVGPGNAGSSLS